MKFICCYCESSFTDFESVILHGIEQHSHEELKYKKRDANFNRIKNFKIIPDLIREQGRSITINESRESIHISKANVFPKDSPYKKIAKVSTSQCIDSIAEDTEILAEKVEEENNDEILENLVKMLPNVLSTLQKSGKLDIYVEFNRLISENKFPLDNIAFVLFLDVVRWYSRDQSTTLFRYSDEVKLFWKTGLRLFHGKFLRFMGGPKHKGKILENESSPGMFRADTGKVNFIVPNRAALEDDIKIVDGNSPGIFQSMIVKMAEKDENQVSTYKLCVDGKKINPSSEGEINLWGYEPSPTYEERQERLQEELVFFNEMQSQLERITSYGHTSTTGLSELEKQIVISKSRNSITILSKRIRDLRQIKVKKNIFLGKLMDKCEGDWRKSNYVMIISSIRTSIYQIDNCVEDLLMCNHRLAQHASIASNETQLIFDESTSMLHMQYQENLVCLGENNDEKDPPLIKQRSEKWSALRKNVLVTGSTINKAVGLEGLKKQKCFLQEKKGLKSPEEFTPEIQRRLDYGTQNEIHAVGTFVSTFLPAFQPHALFYEEGCYIHKSNNNSVLLVSPDGSIRSDESVVLSGVEIKCPYPGKQFTTPVHYDIPHYYVPQILSEMYSLGVNDLYYLSYSKESMSIQQAYFDYDLWNKLYSEIIAVNEMGIPQKMSENIPQLRKSINEYCKSHVKFIAEFKSKMAIQCNHSDSTNTDERIHHTTTKELTKYNGQSISTIQKTFLRCTQLIEDCHKLCTQKASEVLVFLIADLDRSYKPEIPHACPIAYGLKGYSMKVDVMRNMLENVLHALFLKGLYTPVVSYDGQWAKLAFVSATGEPLTILELQKAVYNEVKRKSASDLTKMIFETGVVKSKQLEMTMNTVKVEHYAKSITLSLKKSRMLFCTSSSVKALLKETNTKSRNHVNTRKSTEITDLRGFEIDVVLSNISSEAVHNNEITTTLSDITLNPEEVVSKYEDCFENMNIELDMLFTADKMETTHTPEDEHLIIIDVDDCSVADTKDDSDSGEPTVNEVPMPFDTDKVLKADDFQLVLDMLISLSASTKWQSLTLSKFVQILENVDSTLKYFTKSELLVTLEKIQQSGKHSKLHFCKSWNKLRLAEVLKAATISTIPIHNESTKKKKPKVRNPDSLAKSCKKIIKKFPKSVLNAVVAEHVFADKISQWRLNSAFVHPTVVPDIGRLSWFSKPEFFERTFSYIFSILDVHHLLTNCRIKVCKDGIQERGINKQAWVEVAKSNRTNLKTSHVEDLVDKQNDAIARQTFALEVELQMKQLGYQNEAEFCKLIREFHEAEDEPGICAKERCKRRLALRDWLLEGINFSTFPPYGSHIRGIPNIMFQGYLTNIERRIQLFPYTKSGSYNVRSLGSLEAENFFGQFQDLDPKGSGIIKAQEIPMALESACQLMQTRLMKNRPFHMHLSKAKVYPLHELMETCDEEELPYLFPNMISEIILRDHTFDSKERCKRKAQRKLATIAEPDFAARGVAPVRQYHKCDESKIPAHKRLGIEL